MTTLEVPSLPPTLPPAQACNLSKSEIEQVAAKFAKWVGYEIGKDISPIVTKLGGEIKFLRFDPWYEHANDSIEVSGPRKFIIRLLDVDGPLRHRFTIAHELGHYVLHSKLGKTPLIAGRKGSDRVEWEANWFAAGLLMPEAEFLSAAKKLNNNPLSLAGHFLVSIEAAEVRLKTLNLSCV